MVDLEQQIKAWADATVADAPSTGESIDAAAGFAGRAPAPVLAARQRRGRWLAAAAAVLVVAAVGVGLAVQGDQPERIRAQQTPTGGTPTTMPPVGFVGEIPFDELASVSNGDDAVGLAEAQTAEELATLWSAAGHPRSAPEVDFGRQVVVAVTIADDACPPDLVGFRRDGTTVEPEFVETQSACDEPLVLTTYVAALDWSATGDEFLLALNGWGPDDDQETLVVSRSAPTGGTPTTTTTPQVEPVVSSQLDLDATEVPVGGTLTGTVTVVNDSGAAIDGTTCGDYFVASLRNDEIDQGVFRNACLGPFTIPEGTSTYPVSVTAALTSCTPVEITDPGPEPRCNPDGSMPAFPPGEYELRVDDPQQLVPAIDPVAITVTPA